MELYHIADRPRFRIASRSIFLFCAAVLLISIGSIDFSQHPDDFSFRYYGNRQAASLANASLVNQTSSAKASRKDPGLVTTCGPAFLSGKAGLGNIITKWVPWSQIRTGTICRRVTFPKPFVNVNDIRLFLAVDRTGSDRNNHLTPIVWAERLRRDSFSACLHFKSDFDEAPEYWKEKAEVTWWAIDTEAEAKQERKYIARFSNELQNGSKVCHELPPIANPHSHTILVSASHPGVKYERSYSYEGATHTSRESVVFWLEESNSSSTANRTSTSVLKQGSSSNKNFFMVCNRPLYSTTDVKLEDVKLDVISLARNKDSTGLAKIKLGDYGRGCVYIDADLSKLGAADEDGEELGDIFVQPRVNIGDQSVDGQPLVVAWIEHKSPIGFSVCAKNLVRGQHNAKHTIHIHWMAVARKNDLKDNEICRPGAVVSK